MCISSPVLMTINVSCTILQEKVLAVRALQTAVKTPKEQSYTSGQRSDVNGVAVAKPPGVCWACKWLLNKVKKSISAASSPDEITGKLRAGCEQIGFLRSMCKGFVKRYLSVLVEELSTTDEVRSICVSLKACK
ncbi:antimicrobial peptide NK-lysin-like [Engraulis encrasicolus]|uniref:antimicrobial peptide NK-lysin-like n=1 Tax=Engraulis encrasicolus TaxID=184585 RepID=UPI002FD6F778